VDAVRVGVGVGDLGAFGQHAGRVAPGSVSRLAWFPVPLLDAVGSEGYVCSESLPERLTKERIQ
jgi:hypothetical protein